MTLKEKLINSIFEPIEEEEDEVIEHKNKTEITFEEPKAEVRRDEKVDIEVASSVNEVAPVPEPSVISQGMTINGNIIVDGDVSILGKVIGNVSSTRNVVVNGGTIDGSLKGENIRVQNAKVKGNVKSDNILDIISGSRIEGDITAGNVELNGDVKGDVKCSGFLKINYEGKLIGNIQTSEIEIVRGSQFEGYISCKKA